MKKHVGLAGSLGYVFASTDLMLKRFGNIIAGSFNLVFVYGNKFMIF